MIQVQIDQSALEAIINTAVDRAVTAEREKQHEVMLITGDELCAKFGITRVTLQKWRDRKEIPYIQIDGTIRYDFNKIIQLKETKRKR
ncbi:DNA-binding protein [Sphingobacterium psychroaquaticum]|uniref:helix-turn-helix domain-containing protein n=1 Tax=Sphingobacterium psychroaquaticum TaxID=561061 RepID=UPI00106C1128|nr:DNA-binding protein [Sphingobacterium psychroaquaticum]